MSTVTGLYPNAITPTVSPFGDMAQRAQQRRDNDAAVFAPVEESEASAPGQNRPDRRDGQTGLPPATPSQPPVANIASQRTQAESASVDEAPAPDEASTFERQRDQAQVTREQAEQRQFEQDLETIRELAARDREVRAHEQAHQAVGGQYAGGMALTYERGPDGKRYAVAGEVPIDISPIPGNPAATLAKAEQVRRAALAPAEPSAQDRSVAAAAMQLKMEAQIELRQEFREELAPEEAESGAEADRDENVSGESDTEQPGTTEPGVDEAPESMLASEPGNRDAAVTRSLLDAQYQAQTRADTLGRELDFMV